MAPMSQEDLEWFKSTFRPIPKPQLPEDAIEYSLYLILSDHPPTPTVTDAIAETRSRLQEIQKSASELTKSLLKNYIWQREGFSLEVVKEDGTSLLRGRTNYGDSIEDEWVIVYLLRELTRVHKDLWVKLVDSDGEFLLIEAAGSLPSWLEPEVADNRVWIHDGQLVIIKPRNDKKKVTEKISLDEARKIIVEEPKRLLRSSMIEEEAFYRLRNYPKQIDENMHCALVTLPRKVAYLLHQKPAYISPAVEAFYTRDPIAMRPLKAKDSSSLLFSPEDLVTVSVSFTRVGYAQLKSQDFPTPQAWISKLLPKTDAVTSARTEMGMKLTSGFEMLLSDPQSQDKATVREMKLLLEDVESGDEPLPTDEEIKDSWSHRQDDEKWLDISFEDLEGELKGKARDGSTRTGAFGDQGAQENLQRIVSRFEEFLNDDSAQFDGADFMDSDTDDEDEDDYEMSSDGEDKDLSFDEEEFSNMMKEMMGMPSGSGPQGKPRPLRSGGKVEELGSDSEDDSQQIEELSRQMEAELKPTGILSLNRHDAKASADKPKPLKGKSPMQGDGNDDSEDDTNVNVNLAKNLLESLQSQAGMSGPGGNLLGMMGMKMPRGDR